MAFEWFLCIFCPLRAQSMILTDITAPIFAIGQVDIQASPGTAWLAYSTVSRVNRESLSTPEGSSPTSLLILGNNLCDFPSWHLSRRRWYFYRRHTRRAVMNKGQGGERLSALITTVWCFIFPTNHGALSSVLFEIFWFWLSVFIVVSVNDVQTIVKMTLGIIFVTYNSVSVCCGVQAVTSVPRKFKTAQKKNRWRLVDSN